ncbi:MAG: polysaccharide biosynthesis tyrosine autokinase [Paracoccaceae bacterium]
MEKQLNDEIDLADVLLKLVRGWLSILAFAVTGAIVAALIVVNTIPIYRADAMLQLEEQAANPFAMSSDLAALLGDSGPSSSAEIELLRSRLVLGQVVAAHNLAWVVEPHRMPVLGVMFTRYPIPMPQFGVLRSYARNGESIRLDAFSVPPRWLDEWIRLEIGENGSYTLRLPDDSEITGQAGQLLMDNERGVALTLAEVNAPVGRVYWLKHLEEIRAIANLNSSFSVSEAGRNTGILRTTITGPDETLNERILNAIIQTYQRQNLNRSTAQTQSSADFIAQQLPEAERRLNDAVRTLSEYREAQGSIDLEFEAQALLEQISGIETMLLDLQRREDELRQRYTESHPTYRALLDERERLNSRLQSLRDQAAALPQMQLEVLNQMREVELAQQIYTQMQTRLQEIEVMRASTIGNVRIIDAAASQLNKVKPSGSRTVALGLIVGLALGVARAVAAGLDEQKGITDIKQLDALGISVLATISYSKESDTKSRRSGRYPIMAIERPTDLVTEAFRSLRTSLHFSMLDAQTKTIAITSSHPGAGKSFCALNLAAVTAQAGMRVCVVDTDMRRGQLWRHFGTQRFNDGLGTVLAGDARAEDVIVKGPIDNLFFLPAGKYPPNPAELLMRRTFHELVAYCDANFDLTIFDCPPVLAVTDPIIVARETGATFYVARHLLTPLGEIEAAIHSFEAAGQKFGGIIMNGFDPKKAGSNSYGYGYRYHYQKRED